MCFESVIQITSWITFSNLFQVTELSSRYLTHPVALVLMTLAIVISLVPILCHIGSHAHLGSDLQEYTEDYEQQRGKGSFPAMITPAYQRAKRANQLASQVSILVPIHCRLC